MIKILITVIALLLIMLRISGHTRQFIITPQFAFVVSFIPSLATLSIFVDKWNVDLDNRTVALIISGAFVFTEVSFFSEKLIRKYKIAGPWRNIRHRGIVEINLIRNSTLRLLIFVAFIGVAAYFTYIASFSKRLSVNNIATILMNYRNAYNEESLDMPTFVSITSMASTCIADYCVYYFFTNRRRLHGLRKKKLLLFLCCVPGVLIPLLSGARGGVINFGMFVFAVAIINSTNELQTQRITIRIAILSAVVVVATLRIVGIFMGRAIDVGAVDYMGMYLPAPVRNLDYIIRTEDIGLFSGFGDSANRTFSKLLNFLSFRFGLKITAATGRRTLMANGHYTGNMYTVYYNLLHDAGFIGALLLLALTAFLCQFFFLAIKRKIQGREGGYTSSIAYALIYSYLFLSFFNENFFYNVFTNYFLRQVIFFMLIDWFVRKIRLRLS